MIFEPGDTVKITSCLEGWEQGYVGQTGKVLSVAGEWVDVHFDPEDHRDYMCFNVEELEKLP